MSAGSVLYMTGKSKCTDLGGLYKTMPWTLIFGCVGALSISAFPATSGFTSKSLIIDGAIHAHLIWVWLVLEIASAGVFLHAGIKFPYFVFFAKDKGLRPAESDMPMLLAMGFMSFLCIFLGVYPQPLYALLPYEVHFQAYTFNHVVAQLQLLMFSALVFFLFLPLLKRTETISIDTDWFYRKGLRSCMAVMTGLCIWTADRCERIFVLIIPSTLSRFARKPLSAVAISYMEATGKDRSAIDEFREHRGPETASFGPMGIPVFVSLMFLFWLFAFFAFWD
jgi:multicomponent Na+:H+ antiporter subunit D